MAVSSVTGQERVQVPLRDASVSKLEVTRDAGSAGFEARSAAGSLRFTPEQTTRGVFSRIDIEGYHSMQREGYPALPVRSRLIEIPRGADVEVVVTGYQQEVIDLAGRHVKNRLMPGQPPRVKRTADTLRPFAYNRQAYQANRFLGDSPVEVEDIGTFRHVRLGRLKIAPVSYNPAKHQLKVLNNLEFAVRFSASDPPAGLKSSGGSNPFYAGLQDKTLNRLSLSAEPDSCSSPLTYVVVAPPAFRQSLSSFVRWKHQQGFHVIEAYTDSIGTSPEAIRAFLKQLFEQPAVSPPSFILLAGDTRQVPPWKGHSGKHVTDLHYAEYTGDYLPEVYYGRMPARDTAELNRMIEKTLDYEQYRLADPSYLGRSLLVAGDDEEFEDTYANGQVNYGTSHYFNEMQGIQSYSYLQDPVFGNAAVADSIVHHIDNGVGFANYTAHCASQGWSLPGFQTQDIHTLTPNDKYGLWISNCCETLRFELEECFGEAAIRSAGRGAIGVIGASNDTYWDEDYWWAIGLTSSITAYPTYEESGLGLYDRVFHTHQEEPSEWYTTQGGMMAAGNLAVEASTSSLNAYYWEIYHLLGDPSLMPYFGVPDPLTVSLDKPSLKTGMKALKVTTEPHAYVALTLGSEMLDARYANRQGEALLSFRELNQPGYATLVVTAQNRQPHIRELTIAPDDQPFVVTDSIEIADIPGNMNGVLDYGESATLNVTLKNLSDTFDAYQVRDSISTTDPYLSITDAHESFGSIAASGRSAREAAFGIAVSDTVPDGHQAWIRMHVQGSDARDSLYRWETSARLILHAPRLEIGDEFWLEDPTATPRPLEPGDTGRVYWLVHNRGSAAAKSLQHKASLLKPRGLRLLDTLVAGPGLPAGGRDTLSCRLVADEAMPAGTPVELKLSSGAGKRSRYQVTTIREVFLGTPAVWRINQADTASLCYGLFYDSGGPDEPYANSERHVMTFVPGQAGKSVKAVFKNFDVERSYDWLKVYDGPAVDESTLIARFDNNNPPGVLLAANETGALTFHFHSDYTVTGAGWEVELTCTRPGRVVFDVDIHDPTGHRVRVAFAGDTLAADSTGRAVFKVNNGVYPYTVWATGYHLQNGTLAVEGNSYQKVSLQPILYPLRIRVADEEAGPVDKVELQVDTLLVLTDSSGSANLNLPGGEHVITAFRPGYHRYQGSFRLSGGLDLDITLAPMVSSVPEARDEQVLIYPNPARERVYVECSRQALPVEVGLFTLTGEGLSRRVFYETKGVLNLSSYAKGLYFLRVRTARGEKLYKILLQ